MWCTTIILELRWLTMEGHNVKDTVRTHSEKRNQVCKFQRTNREGQASDPAEL